VGFELTTLVATGTNCTGCCKNEASGDNKLLIKSNTEKKVPNLATTQKLHSFRMMDRMDRGEANFLLTIYFTCEIVIVCHVSFNP
jgi:hypothetical protein